MSNGGQIFCNTGSGANGVGTSTTTLQVVFGYLVGQPGMAVNFELFNANSPCTVQALNLASGNNVIDATNCPALATAAGVFLIPPTGNGATIAIKGIAADTGIPLGYTNAPNGGPPSFLSFAATPPSSFVIATNSTVTNFLMVFV